MFIEEFTQLNTLTHICHQILLTIFPGLEIDMFFLLLFNWMIIDPGYIGILLSSSWN